MKIEDIEKLCAEATPGPWIEDVSIYHLAIEAKNGKYICGRDGDDVEDYNGKDSDTQFVAASRDLIPKLLAVAKAARKCDEEGWLDENEYGADHPLSLIAKALRELEQD